MEIVEYIEHRRNESLRKMQEKDREIKDLERLIHGYNSSYITLTDILDRIKYLESEKDENVE